MQGQKRQFQIALLGATGFTGRLVANYLARTAPPSLSWALVGRSASKLQEIQDELQTQNCPPKTVLIADTSNQTQLDDVTSKANVLCTTVGPYALYGDLVVASCIAQKCHYCDLTGEVAWIKKNVERHHARAQEAGVYLVHCSGFDSIPSDLGTLFVVNYIRDKLNKKNNSTTDENNNLYEVGEVKSIFYPMKGGVSGGTIASVLNMMKEPWSVLKDVSNPHCITPQFTSSISSSSSSSSSGLAKIHAPAKDLQWVEWDGVAKRWTAPFVMNAINSRVVWRSSVLHQRPYGPLFSYREVMGTRSFVEAVLVSVVLLFGLLLLTFSVGRKIAEKFLPKPGEGPSKEVMEKGYYKVTFYALAKAKKEGLKDRRVVATVVGNKDPGYADTAKMLAETAMALVDVSSSSSSSKVGTTGVTTPAAAVGEALIERLKKVDIQFEIEKDEEI